MLRGNLRKRSPDILNIRLDESRVIEKRAQLFHARRIIAHRLPGALNIFKILSATRIRAISRRDESERVFDSVGAHLSERIGEQRVPVSIAKIDRKREAMRSEFLFQS